MSAGLERAGLSRSEIAERAGLSKATIWRGLNAANRDYLGETTSRVEKLNERVGGGDRMFQRHACEE